MTQNVHFTTYKWINYVKIIYMVNSKDVTFSWLDDMRTTSEAQVFTSKIPELIESPDYKCITSGNHTTYKLSSSAINSCCCQFGLGSGINSSTLSQVFLCTLRFTKFNNSMKSSYIGKSF